MVRCLPRKLPRRCLPQLVLHLNFDTMNATEHLLACLAEECGEVAKEVSKSLRFGLDDKVTMDPHGPRGTEGPDNRRKIADEMVDLLAVYQMCVSARILPDLGISTTHTEVIRRVVKKQKKVEAYMDYARRVGSLENDQNPSAPL